MLDVNDAHQLDALIRSPTVGESTGRDVARAAEPPSSESTLAEAGDASSGAA